MVILEGSSWEPDDEYYRNSIAKIIVFTRAEKIARQIGFSAYRANAVSYTVALVAYRTCGRLKLEEIWKNQDVSDALEETMRSWMPRIHEEIVESAEAVEEASEGSAAASALQGLKTILLAVFPLLLLGAVLVSSRVSWVAPPQTPGVEIRTRPLTSSIAEFERLRLRNALEAHRYLWATWPETLATSRSLRSSVRLGLVNPSSISVLAKSPVDASSAWTVKVLSR